MKDVSIETNLTNLKNHQKFNQIKRLIDDFFQKEKFTQIDVPLLSPVLIPESYLEIFKTDNFYLIPSPELYLKRLMVAGLGDCYFLGKAFRNNEPREVKHSHEFTILEFYRLNKDYFDIITDVMNLLSFIAKKLYGKKEIIYQGKKINLNKFEKITVADAFKKYTGITDIFNHKEFFKQAKAKGYRIDNMNYTDLWSQIYGLSIEPHLGKNGLPTFIYEYPRELAAITQFDEERNVAQRFEFYIEGIELGNCGNEATENTNIKEHQNRFKNDIKIRKKLKMNYIKPDYEFIDVLSKLPPSAGIAIGIDRLIMLFANLTSIQDLQVINIV